MKKYLGLILFILLFIFTPQPINAQIYDLDFKVRELTHGTGGNIAGVKIEIDDGKFIGLTDESGVAHFHRVNDGMHKISISKQGYIQFIQEGYSLNGNKTFNASLLSKVRVGPWGTDNFNVSWWRQSFWLEYMGNRDIPRWKQIAPIYNRISPNPTYNPIYYAPDSINIIAAISEVETKTGYDLITLVPRETSPDTSFTLYPRTGNFGTIGFDENYIISSGYALFSTTTPLRRIIHEMVKQFGMNSIVNSAFPSVLEPDISLVTDMQPWDADNIAVTFDQHYAKQRGEQDLFLGNMMEYVTPTNPTATSITLPIDNSTDVEKAVRFIWNNIAGTDRYHINIATDETFTNISKDLFINRNDTSITLENDVQYFVRVRQENTVGNSVWSTIIKFKTEPYTPGLTSISAPVNNSTKIDVPVQFELSQASGGTKLYEILIALDAGFLNIVKDTLVSILNPVIPLMKGTIYYAKVRAKNSTGFGQWSENILFRTIKNIPENTEITKPLNNSTKVLVPVPHLIMPAINAEDYELYIGYNMPSWGIGNNYYFLKDTVLTDLNPVISLPNGANIEAKVRARNSDVNGEWSSPIRYSTIKGTPESVRISRPMNGQLKIVLPVEFYVYPIVPNFINIESIEILIATDVLFNSIIKDTTVLTVLTQIPGLTYGTKYYSKARARNSDLDGPWSETISFTTFDNAPTISTGAPISTDIIDATQPTVFTYVGADIDLDPMKFDIHLWSAKTDTTITDIVGLLYTLSANKLKSNTKYNYTITAKSGTKQTTSNTQTFNTFNNAPTISTGTPTSTDILDSRQPTVFTYISSDKDNDPLAFGIHLWSAATDTTMNGITGLTYTLPANRLKEKTSYSYTITVSDGTKQTTSSTQTFNTKDNTVVIIFPGATSLTKPANNAVDVPTSNTPLECEAATNTLQYRYVGKDLQGNIVLDSLVNSNTETTTKRFKGNRTYTLEVTAKNNNGYGPTSTTNTFKTFNHAPNGFDIILANSISNGVIQYINKKIGIGGTPATDIDNDVLSKKYTITGPSLDTLIHATNIETIYLDSARLQPDSEYRITAEVTDQDKPTQANNIITFKTPKAVTGIEEIILGSDFRIYPNPVSQDVFVEYYLLQDLEITICLYNLDGKKMICKSFDKTTGSQSHKINLSSIGKGIYILRLETYDSGLARQIKAFKIIKN